MPDTHDIGRWYWHLQQYPDFADWALPVRMPYFTELATTHEIEPPFRTGRGRAFRAWPTRWAVVIGRWAKRAYDHETVALERATGGRMLVTQLGEIKQWPGAAPDEDGPFADTPGVVSWEEPDAAGV